MENSNVAKIVIGFFMIILGVVLIASVANSSDLVVSQISTVNETIDIGSARNETAAADWADINSSVTLYIANVPSGWRIADCIISGVAMRNEAGTALVRNTDYNFTESTGGLWFMNTTNVVQGGAEVNVTSIDYTRCPLEYLNIAWGRSVLNLVAGFFALAIMGLGIGLFYSVAKDAGIV